ncbi:Auxin response factor 18 [Linum grandiflorum]
MASSMFNAAPAAPSLPIQRNDPLTDELWNLCAPCTAGLPKVEQRVYYFLQGHMEQVERGSDEVYAQITLEAETYVKNWQPRRHLLSTGWSTFVNAKNLVSGDAFVFLRGENGEMKVGIRRQAWEQPPFLSTIMSPKSLNAAVLGSATHAISTPFIIGVNKYLDGMRHGFQVGMRVRMIVEGEYPAVGYTGRIVEVGDSSPQWPGSQWRSLRVEWDEASGNERPPNRVSPWEVEPCAGSPFLSAGNKRTRSNDVADAGRDSGSSSGRTGQVQNESRNLGESTGQPSNVPLQLFPASGRSNGQKDKGKLNENLRLFGFDLTGNSTDASQLQRPSTVDYFASCSTSRPK